MNKDISQNKNHRLRHGDLFAGIAGFTKAAEETDRVTTTHLVEKDAAAQRVLRFHFPKIPIHPDIQNYWPNPQEFDLLTIGFPCTGTSSAGKRTGLSHPHSALWKDGLRCICLSQPSFIVVEQPEGFIHRGLRTVLGGLSIAGYETEIELLSAAAAGAPHRRNRIFIIAYRKDILENLCQKPERWEKQLEQTYHDTSHTIHLEPDWLRNIPLKGWWSRNYAPSTLGVEQKLLNRRTCCDLYAKSVTPQQATIALNRVIYLFELCSISHNRKSTGENALRLWEKLQSLSNAELNESITDQEWQIIKNNLKISRKRENINYARRRSLLPTPTTYAKGNGNCRPAGATKLEQSLKPFLKGKKISSEAIGWMMGYPARWVEECLMSN